MVSSGSNNSNTETAHSNLADVQLSARPATARASEMSQLINRLRQLQPWRMNIQITPQLNTGDWDAKDHSDVKAAAEVVSGRDRDREKFLKLIDSVFPDGLNGKRFLDCGCNAGGYCFWVRERNAEIGYGFDAREHWIKQARFVRNHRTVGPTDRTQFEIFNLYDLPAKDLFPFDIVQFNSLFCHLPDPINGLKVAADLSRDLLIFSTAYVRGEADGTLKMMIKEDVPLHGGIGQLSWYPTGPGVCAEIIRHLGFEELKLTKTKQTQADPRRGRLDIVAARERCRLANLAGEII